MAEATVGVGTCGDEEADGAGDILGMIGTFVEILQPSDPFRRLEPFVPLELDFDPFPLPLPSE